MKARSWSNHYSKNEFDMYAWSIGKILHIPFKTLEIITGNEQIMLPMNLWTIVYEITDKQDYASWCCERNEQQQETQYLFDTQTPVPCIMQKQRRIIELYKTGKMKKLYGSNVGNPDRHVNNL
jgi:hypothetical protein